MARKFGGVCGGCCRHWKVDTDDGTLHLFAFGVATPESCGLEVWALPADKQEAASSATAPAVFTEGRLWLHWGACSSRGAEWKAPSLEGLVCVDGEEFQGGEGACKANAFEKVFGFSRGEAPKIADARSAESKFQVGVCEPR